jgi:hypothetical protein
MLLDLLLILVAVSPLIPTTSFLVRHSGTLYPCGDERLSAWPMHLGASPAGHPHPTPGF